MDSAELTKLQRTSFRLLSNTFDQDALQTTCPLDHGRHNPSAKYDLGVLSRLPTELQHQILGDVDVQSLLTFRRVNQTAMLVVNAMLEYHKVITLAPSCIRMAVAIKTAHTFTIKEMLTKLYQTHCDGKGCTKTAPYLDVFTLTRRCLSINNGCPHPQGPVSEVMLNLNFGFEINQLPSRSFQPILCEYNEYFELSELEGPFFDYQEVKAALWSKQKDHLFKTYENLSALEDPFWKLCSIPAPWISKLGIHADFGVLCELCTPIDPRSNQRRSLAQMAEPGEAVGSDRYVSSYDFEAMSFLRMTELDEHVQKMHGKTSVETA